jgi:hypothetical protein
MFEHRSQRPLPRPKWRRRLAWSVTFAGTIVALALATGVLGYRYIAGFSWIDSLLEAAMILSGMGPVNALSSVGAKLFAAAYALASGFVFLGAAGVLAAPWLHRLMHLFHAEPADGRKD